MLISLISIIKISLLIRIEIISQQSLMKYTLNNKMLANCMVSFIKLIKAMDDKLSKRG